GRAGIANEIVQHAYDTGTELIVMTTHGYGRFKRFWLGSVADAVIRLCRIPVLLMRPRDQARIGLKDEPQFRNILILLDGSSVAESIFDHAFAIGGTAAQYTLFHALPLMPVYSAEFVMAAAAVNGELRVAQRQSAQATLDQAATRLRQHDARLQVRTEVSSDDFAAGAILDYAEQNHVDLIALTTHGAGGVVRLMLGSVADKITRGAEVPVLLYRPA
ncbi:MAG: universal stress protein, partial [Gemmatimonadota bacterium]